MKARVRDTAPWTNLHGAVGEVTSIVDDYIHVTLTIDGQRSPWRFLPSEVDLITGGEFTAHRSIADVIADIDAPLPPRGTRAIVLRHQRLLAELVEVCRLTTRRT